MVSPEGKPQRCRGIAQLVEQRSPKPRAVSSKLTTPAMTHRFFGTCAFCFLNPLRRSRARFPLLSPAVTSSPGRGKSALKGTPYGIARNFIATAKSRPLGEGGCDQRGLYAAFAKNCIFRKFVLDNRPTFRYNRARSRGKMPHELERSWPGSSVG